MTVKELKEKLNEYPDDMEVGGSGHFGEILEIQYLSLYDNYDAEQTKYLALSIEYAGIEPD